MVSSLSACSDGLCESCVKLCPVILGIALTLGLTVDEYAVLSVLGRLRILVEIECDLKSAGGAVVASELHAELAGVFCFDALCDHRGILVIASATAVVDNNEVGRGLASLHLG